MKSYDTPLTHIAVWTGYITIAILVYGYGYNDWFGTTFETSYSHLISAGVFYISCLFLFPKLLSKKRYIYFAFLSVLTLAASILLRFYFVYHIYPWVMGKAISVANSSPNLLIRKFFFQWFSFSLYSFLYWRSTVDRNQSRREKLELEIAVLRAQINPHFTMNSLNIFMAQSAQSDPKLSMGIAWFMKILRSGISMPAADGKIPLGIETDAIRGTIYIFKERFPELEVQEQIDVDEDDQLRILPHVLLPFVENAFKHGAYHDPNHPITVCLKIKDNRIDLNVYNKIGNRIKDGSTGIGLRYVRRHLETGYPGCHSLTVIQTEETYNVKLSLQLN